MFRRNTALLMVISIMLFNLTACGYTFSLLKGSDRQMKNTDFTDPYIITRPFILNGNLISTSNEFKYAMRKKPKKVTCLVNNRELYYDMMVEADMERVGYKLLKKSVKKNKIKMFFIKTAKDTASIHKKR